MGTAHRAVQSTVLKDKRDLTLQLFETTMHVFRSSKLWLTWTLWGFCPRTLLRRPLSLNQSNLAKQ